MKVYFSGIGGAGLSALATMSYKLGYTVLGSDISETSISKHLEDLGIKIFYSQEPSNLTSDIDLYIYSAAIKETNPEYIQAKNLGITVQRREYLINQLISNKESFGVCGTHGKTTTTSLLAHCLIEIGEDPSYLIGGILQGTGKSSDVGKGNQFIWEADEYSNAFWGVNLNYTIFNNCEYDHPDFFKTFEEYKNSFKYFMENNITKSIFANFDDQNVVNICKNIDTKKLISFGTSLNYELDEDEKLIDYCANSINFGSDNTQFIITHKGEHYFIVTQLHGLHNIYNTTAVFALLHNLGFDSGKIVSAILTFKGVSRRFETIIDNKNVLVISDYAHHPTAIRTTIESVESLGLPIVAVFEPHQYSRLIALKDDFENCFKTADEVLILPIYSAREKNVTQDFAQTFANNINHNNKKYVKSYDELVKIINTYDINKKVYLCMSAGPLDEYIRKNLV